MTILTLAFVLPLLTCLHGAKILFHAMHSSHSHMGSMFPVAKALSEAGHEVHFLETSMNNKSFPFPKSIKNHFIVFPEKEAVITEAMKAIWRRPFSTHGMMAPFEHGDLALQKLMNAKSLEFERMLNTTWDLVFADELFSLTSYGLALRNFRVHRKPYIMFSTTALLQLSGWEQSLSRFFASRPPFQFPVLDDGSFDIARFSDRFYTFFEETLMSLNVKFVTENFYTKGIGMMGIEDFSFSSLWKGSTYNFQEEINGLVFPQPIASDVIQTGFHCLVKKGLPTELKSFVEDPKSQGTVYIAFGTFVPWSFAEQKHIESFVHLVVQLKDYRVIFVYNGNELGNMPGHVKVLKWAPQYEILKHPKTMLFISHCGLKSFKESICTKTPTICLPLFAEQSHNAIVGNKLGFARTVSKFTITPKKLLAVAKDMLTDAKYKTAVGRAYDLYLDRPLHSLDEAVFWTNRALRTKFHKPTFKRRGVHLSSLWYFYIVELALLISCIYTAG